MVSAGGFFTPKEGAVYFGGPSEDASACPTAASRPAVPRAVAVLEKPAAPVLPHLLPCPHHPTRRPNHHGRPRHVPPVPCAAPTPPPRRAASTPTALVPGLKPSEPGNSTLSNGVCPSLGSGILRQPEPGLVAWTTRGPPTDDPKRFPFPHPRAERQWIACAVEVLEAGSEAAPKTHHGEQSLEQHQLRERGERAVAVESDLGSDPRRAGSLDYREPPAPGPGSNVVPRAPVSAPAHEFFRGTFNFRYRRRDQPVKATPYAER